MLFSGSGVGPQDHGLRTPYQKVQEELGRWTGLQYCLKAAQTCQVLVLFSRQGASAVCFHKGCGPESIPCVNRASVAYITRVNCKENVSKGWFVEQSGTTWLNCIAASAFQECDSCP
ncbi:hypothetical protein AV530_000521 [Patagioenas fasciata monilis]|uniref:Uncharacterized protein n=1 Tax=Patagioenas fasciata monilis TaxID=372326 RepID=A0A1V4IFZ4_PATFA|nr:hypothetical protein AV530_000521 [Patagioenas fasciata monilis]